MPQGNGINRRSESARNPVVEILYFEDCPNHEQTYELVEVVAAKLGLQPTIALVDVPDPAAAARLRFLGSPSVRVDGRDVEPDAERRHEFALSCRVYHTAHGLSRQPDRDWIRSALEDALSR
jgi:hypothetical protein